MRFYIVHFLSFLFSWILSVLSLADRQGILTVHMNIVLPVFHCFGALGVRPGALSPKTQPGVWAWRMGMIIAIVETWSLGEKVIKGAKPYLKTTAHGEGFFNPRPPN